MMRGKMQRNRIPRNFLVYGKPGEGSTRPSPDLAAFPGAVSSAKNESKARYTASERLGA